MIKRSLRHLLLAALVASSCVFIHAKPAVDKKAESIILKSENSELNEAIARLAAERQSVEAFGVVLANIHDFPPELAKLAKKEFNLSDRLQIISVEKDSLADKLDLKPGDQLLQINSFYVTRGQKALEQFADRIHPSVDWTDSIKATVIRDGYGQDHSLKASATGS